MISFLNPWLWLGVVALGAPLWLHLRRRDREEIIRFSALRFLEDQPVARQAPLQLRDLLLFLLRVLAVLLLIAAFCRPFFPQNALAISSSEVYILDNTLSRQADQGMERDRDFLVQQIHQSGPRDQIAVVEMASEPRVITGFGDSPAQAEAKLKALQPTTERGSILAALRQADFLLKQSLGERKHITILSDQQENQWTENSNTPPFLAPGMVSLSPFSGIASRPNFFVSEPKLQRIFIGDTALMQFTAQLGHTGDVNAALVKLTANGKEIINQPVEIDPKTEQVTVAAKWEADPLVWLQGSISVEAQPDDLPQDNVAYFTFPPVTEGRVALLTESVYVRTALSSAVARGHWKTEQLQPSELAAALSASPDTDDDVLMVDANYLQSSLARELVHRYLQEGRGVFIMVGQLSTLLTGFLEEMGFTPRLGSDDGTAKPLQPLRYFAAESAIFQPFIVPDFSNLLEVRVGNNVRLESKSAKPILFSQDGDSLLYECNRDKGRLLLSTFAFDRDQTDWVVHPTFVPFLDSALEYLRPQPSLNATLEPGEMWAARIPAEKSVKTAILRSEGKEVARATVTPEHLATLRAPDPAGLYTLTYDDDPAVQQMLAVNPSSLESILRYAQADPDMLKAWTLATPPPASEHPAGGANPSISLAAQQILWWKFLLAGFAVLLLEMVLSTTRRGEVS